MADIELVIKISEEDYESIKDDVKKFLSMPSHKVPVLYEAVNKGIPLPKGHGRIIDESQITGTFIWDNGYIECYAPTIIEADYKQKA